MLAVPEVASAMNAPMPAPLIRPMTYPAPMSRMSATAEAIRTPVAMNGAALRSDTNHTTESRPKPKARSVSRATGSTSSSPAIVLYMIGHRHP